jgi:RNA polymerase sigma-70 factor (ECF subfamily)
VRVYRFVLRFLNDEAAVEDLVRKLFLDVWRQVNRFEARSHVFTWLLAIARNNALSGAASALVRGAGRGSCGIHRGPGG